MAKRASMKDRRPVPVMSEDALHLVDAVMDAPAGAQIKSLPVDQIDRDENQPRQTFDEEELQELADSIRMKGVQQPIGVRPVEDRYRIIWGERRW